MPFKPQSRPIKAKVCPEPTARAKRPDFSILDDLDALRRQRPDDLEDVAELRRLYPDLPTHALSIRQPWSFFVVNGFKDIENRTWRTHYRGPVLIHAGGTVAGWFDGEEEWWPKVLGGRDYPQHATTDDMPRGGIVGVADVVDCVESSDSPWFFGPFGFVLENPRVLPFTPCHGALNFFKV